MHAQGASMTLAGTHAIRLTVGIVLGLACGLAGCAAGTSSQGERYELSHLNVVFLEEQEIQHKWEEVTGRSPVMMTPRLVMETARRLETVVGFYDVQTRTIYCPKMDFEVCGHELHHAVLGRFHLDH